MTTRPPVLVTRPRAGAVRFARAWAERAGEDWPVVISPLLEILPLPASPPPLSEPADRRLVVTSRPGAERAAALLEDRPPTLAVGPATAACLAAAGFPVTGVFADAAALARALARMAPAHFLHLRGRHVARDLAGPARALGHRWEELVVYDQQPRRLSGEAHALLARRGTVLLPVFSPRSAAILAAQTAGLDPAGWRIVAISQGSAAALGPALAPQAQLARRPDLEGMIDALLSAAEG